MVAYYQSWSSGWKANGADLDLANLPAYVNVVVVSFAQPDCKYTKGSLVSHGAGIGGGTRGGVVGSLQRAQGGTGTSAGV
jgi:hypothetical protein